ncbi:MAG: hypothetical protein PWP23_19 [Candidatus Sumerlaeota bacterium]|nr:hypothetical protein [Candidatus Sumerlaeota bacterium]
MAGVANKSALEAGGQLAAVGFSLVSGILVSRLLGADGRGAYVLTTVIATTFFVALGDLGLSAAFRVFAAREPELMGRLHGAAIAVAVAAGAVGGLGAVLARRYALGVGEWMDARLLIGVALGLPFLLYQSFWRGLVTGLGAIREKAAADVAFAAIQCSGIFLVAFAVPGRPVAVFIGVYFLVAAVVGLAMGGRLAVRFDARPLAPGLGLLRRLFAYGKWVYAGDVGARLRLQVDQVFAQALGGEAVLGRYNQGASLAGRSLLFPTALVTASYQSIVASPRPEALRLVASAFRQCLLMGVVLTALGWVAAPLIPLIYGADFAASVAPFRLLVPAIALLGASQVLAAYFSGHLADPRVPAAVNWMTLGVEAAACLVCVPLAGVLMGVALGTAITCAATLGFFLWAFLRRPETPGVSTLLRFERGDVLAWMRLVAGVRSAVTSRKG